jgi:HAD superfamily hydrolase (TIGR01490 family)
MPFLPLPRDVPIIWDLDKTLLPISAGSEFVRFLLAKRHIPAFKRYRFYLAHVLYHVRLLPAESALREAYSLFIGLDLARLDRLAQTFVDKKIEPLFFVEALERLEVHRSNGNDVTLLSGSPEFLVRHIGARLHFDQFTGTRYTSDGGIIAELREPLCYGEGKVILFRTLVSASARPHVYADDHMDLPLLKIARSASLVNPSRSFLVKVESLGLPFEILHWTRTIGEKKRGE